MAPPRILIVEDEPHLARGIADNMEAEGYAVEICADGEDALKEALRAPPDLLILDVMLPRRDGYAVCEALRAAGAQMPILFLTAKASSDERVRGLAAGGDDYLGKPFDLRELLLRVRAMLRRSAAAPAQLRIVIGGCQINLSTHEVTDADGRVELLTPKEALTLRLFHEQPHNMITREMLLARVWGNEIYPASRSIDALIDGLRARFEDDPTRPRIFITVPGEGHRYVPQEQP